MEIKNIHVLNYSTGSESAEGGGELLKQGVEEGKRVLVLHRTLISLAKHRVVMSRASGAQQGRHRGQSKKSGTTLSFWLPLLF